MKRDDGLYITTNGKKIFRAVVSMGGETKLPETTAAEEVIDISELEMETYIKFFDYVGKICPENNKGDDSFDFFYDCACSLLDDIYDCNILYGVLIRNAVFENLPDEVSQKYFQQIKKNIIYGLSEIIDVNYTVNDILERLYLGKEVELTYTHKRYGQARCTHIFTMGEELKEELYFNSLQSYFSFLIMKFLSDKPKVELCQYCGKYFIPKTKKETFYCDRIVKNGRSCKQIAPAEKHLVQAKENAVIKAFDMNKKKMYKRCERTRDLLHETEKGLTLSEYFQWLDRAERTRSEFLKGEISEEEALEAICV